MGTPLSTQPDVSAVIVSYNNADWLARCLDSLPAAFGSLRAQVIVVENASTDGSAEVADRPDVELVRNDVNVGFAAAVNQGARLATAPWVLLLNPDMEALPGSLEALVRFGEEHPENHLYGGRTLNPDGALEPSSCWDLPTLWSTATFAFGLSTLFAGSKLFDPEAIPGWDRSSVREVGMITGCLLLVDAPTWQALGGLDERYFVYGEDADFSARARAMGARPILTPTSEVIHRGGVSSGSKSNRWPLVLAGRVTYAEAIFTGWRRRVAVALIRGGAAVRALGARLTGRAKHWQVAWKRRADWWNGFPPEIFPGGKPGSD